MPPKSMVTPEKRQKGTEKIKLNFGDKVYDNELIMYISQLNFGVFTAVNSSFGPKISSQVLPHSWMCNLDAELCPVVWVGFITGFLRGKQQQSAVRSVCDLGIVWNCHMAASFHILGLRTLFYQNFGIQNSQRVSPVLHSPR